MIPVPMQYAHDIFISYKRHPEAYGWIKSHFEPLLAMYVELELGRTPNIFIDSSLEAGTTWPLELGARLGASAVLVALYTRTYFHSEWCGRELGVMLEREQAEGYRTVERPRGLIVPAVLHDCERLPDAVANIQCREIRECFNPRMSRESPRAERLADEIAMLAVSVAHAIEGAPQPRPGWSRSAGEAFLRSTSRSPAGGQTVVPRMSV